MSPRPPQGIKKVFMRFLYLVLLAVFAVFFLPSFVGVSYSDFFADSVNFSELLGVLFFGLIALFALAFFTRGFLTGMGVLVGYLFIANVVLFISAVISDQSFNGYDPVLFFFGSVAMFAPATVVVFSANWVYEKLPSKRLRYLAMIVPFVIVFIAGFFSGLTCAFGNDAECVINKPIRSEDTSIKEKAVFSCVSDGQIVIDETGSINFIPRVNGSTYKFGSYPIGKTFGEFFSQIPEGHGIFADYNLNEPEIRSFMEEGDLSSSKVRQLITECVDSNGLSAQESFDHICSEPSLDFIVRKSSRCVPGKKEAVF